MPNLSISVNTNNFKPYTFDELAKPLMLLQAQWEKERDRADKVIDAYGNLNLPAGSKASRDYQDMLQQQQDAMEAFYSGSFRTSMPKMIKAFDLQRSKGARLKEAAKQYQTWQDLKIKGGNDTIWGHDLTIDDIYLGNKPTAIPSISRKDVVTGAAAYATGLVKGMQSDPTFKQVYDGIVEQSWTTPMTNDQIMRAALQKYSEISPNNYNVASNYMKRYMDSLGVDAQHGFDQDAQNQTWDAVTDGFISAMTNNSQLQQDSSRSWLGQGLENQLKQQQVDYYTKHPEAVGSKNSNGYDSDNNTDPNGFQITGKQFAIGLDGNAYSTSREAIEYRNKHHRSTALEEFKNDAAKQGRSTYWNKDKGLWDTYVPNKGTQEYYEMIKRQNALKLQDQAVKTGQTNQQSTNSKKTKTTKTVKPQQVTVTQQDKEYYQQMIFRNPDTSFTPETIAQYRVKNGKYPPFPKKKVNNTNQDNEQETNGNQTLAESFGL